MRGFWGFVDHSFAPRVGNPAKAAVRGVLFTLAGMFSRLFSTNPLGTLAGMLMPFLSARPQWAV